MSIKSTRDTYGTSYSIPAAPAVRTPAAKVVIGLPAIEVWWSRTLGSKSEETLVIRQEYPDRAIADVIELTLGQAYGLIEALNKAVERT